MFSVDGITWDIPCSIQRTSEVKASEISGLMLDRSYFNDVVGTYMQYTIGIAVPFNMMDQYAAIYEALTDPVDAHTFVVPYNNGTITVVARVQSISDVYVRLANGGKYWKGIQFTIVANHPSKEKSLSQVMARGRTPLPEPSAVQLGDIYTYTSTGWTHTQYVDVDNKYY